MSRSTAILAHPVTLAVFAVPTILLMPRPRESALRVGVALPLAVGASKVVKRLFPRHKPRVLTVTPHESLPSGHSVGVMAIAASLVDAHRAWTWTPVALGAGLFVNAMRVRDREHRLSEVLIGDAIGLAGAVAAGVIARRIERALADRRAAKRVRFSDGRAYPAGTRSG